MTTWVNHRTNRLSYRPPQVELWVRTQVKGTSTVGPDGVHVRGGEERGNPDGRTYEEVNADASMDERTLPAGTSTLLWYSPGDSGNFSCEKLVGVFRVCMVAEEFNRDYISNNYSK